MVSVDSTIITLFQELGVPVGFLVLMYILYVKTQIWNQKITEETTERYATLVKDSQDRYEELTNRFIDTTNKIIAKNAEAIQISAVAMQELTNRIDNHDARTTMEIIPKITAKDDIILKIQATIDDMYSFLKETLRTQDKRK